MVDKENAERESSVPRFETPFPILYIILMQHSAATSDLLDTLEELSQGKLSRRDDLGTLIELATRHDQMPVLDDLSFLAKFVSKTYGIMARIGKEGQGYDGLQREFAASLENAGQKIRSLIAGAPEGEREPFLLRYLSPTPDALRNLLALCYDLSWYKNWLIDR